MASLRLEPKDYQALKERIESAIAHHRPWYMFQAMIFIIGGILAMVLPQATALGVELLIGVLLLVSGLVQGIASLRSKLHWWSLLSSLAAIIIGGLMLGYPLTGTVALATVLAVFLAIEGALETLLALEFRPAKNWGWLLASGIVSMVLAALLFAGWPEITVLFLGVIVGINLLFYGVALLALTLHVKHA